MVQDVGKLRVELFAIVGKESHGNAPLAYLLFDESACSALGGEFDCSDSVYRGMSAEPNGEKGYVLVVIASRRFR